MPSLRPHDLSCLLDLVAMKRDGAMTLLHGDIETDRLWRAWAPGYGYRTSTVRRLLDAGFVEQPVVAFRSRADFGRPNRFQVRLTTAGEAAARAACPGHALFASPAENRAAWRVVPGRSE